VDSSAVPRHSHRLAGLPPSTSPPPLGERPRQSRKTISHIDSHTMGDHSEDTSESLPPPIRVDDGAFTPSYDISPDLTKLGPMISEIGALQDTHIHSRPDPSLQHYRYGMPKDAETHFAPASTNYGSYGMSGFPTHDLAFHVESEFEPNTIPRGTLIPYHAERFGSTSHITPSIPMEEVTSHIPPRSRVSDPIRIPDPR